MVESFKMVIVIYICFPQLLELAERRFRAAQLDASMSHPQLTPSKVPKGDLPSFDEIFKHVDVEDVSSFVSKLTTPRELLIMLTEILSRAEASPTGKLSAQDLEIAVTKAMEQSV